MEIIAHRGASAHAPENTLAAVRLAWEQNVAGVEVDVHLSKDQQLVVVHDSNLARLAGLDITVDALTARELGQIDVASEFDRRFAGETIPTLRDVLATVPDGKRILVEVKCGPECVDSFAADLDALTNGSESVTIIGFDLPTMALCKKQYPQQKIYLVAEQILDLDTWRPSVSGLIEAALANGLDGLDLSNTLGVNRETVAEIHDSGLESCIWTVNSVEDGKRLREAGVDAITTDDPTLFIH